MALALQNPVCRTPSPRTQALEGTPLVSMNAADEQILDVDRRSGHLVVVLAGGIGDGRSQRLFDNARRTSRQILKNRQGFFHRLATDQIDDLPDLCSWDDDVSLYGSRFHLRLPLRKARGSLIGSAVRAECARRRELSQLVTYHIFGDIHRDELVAVMHGNVEAYKLGQDDRPPGPGFDQPTVLTFVCG